jgi:hypothetical protein
MNKKITLILDYKDRFETKFTADPYRSGMDKEKLKYWFNEYNIDVEYTTYTDINFSDGLLKEAVFLYSSSEDNGLYYKSFIEDVILGLAHAGARVIPDYLYLRAHHNKVFMEILLSLSLTDRARQFQSKYFGTIESLLRYKENFPVGKYVVKPAEGSMSRGISEAFRFTDIIKSTKKISRTFDLFPGLKDTLRKLKHKGYLPDSVFRKKFLVQKKIDGLSGDWKILIYSHKYYILKRANRKDDFRASGGGLLGYTLDIPAGILDFAEQIFKLLNVPNLSLDIGYDGKTFNLFEFQCLYFGTYTLEKSDFYFIRNGKAWINIFSKSCLEEEYARSVSEYILNGFKNYV